jgi:hypothetical protein
MNKSLLTIFALLSFLIAWNRCEGEELLHATPEDVAHGAVLCSWWISIEMRLTSDRCFPNEDSELKAALDESIEKMDQFIMDNMPMTQEQFADFKQKTVSALGGMHACRGAYMDMYEHIRHAPVDRQAIRERTLKLLAVPRKPAANPCL